MVSEQLRIPWVDPLTFKIKKRTLNLIREESAKRLKVVPLFHLENVLTVACSDQNNVHVVDELSEETVMEINIVLASERNIDQALELHHRVQTQEELTTQQQVAAGNQVSADNNSNKLPQLYLLKFRLILKLLKQ